MKQRQREQVQRGCAVGTVVLLAWLCRVLPLEGLPSGLREACGILRLCNRQMFRVYRALSGRDLQSLKELHQQVWAPAPETPVLPAVQDAKLIQTGTSGCLAARGRRTGFRDFRKGAAQRAVFFSSGASGLFSRFSSGISSLLMMVSICSSFFTSSLGKRLFTRWTPCSGRSS